MTRKERFINYINGRSAHERAAAIMENMDIKNNICNEINMTLEECCNVIRDRFEMFALDYYSPADYDDEYVWEGQYNWVKTFISYVNERFNIGLSKNIEDWVKPEED